MTIPNVVYQTWRTKQLPLAVEEIRNEMKLLNPEYDFILYDDDDMKLFIETNFHQEIFDAYCQLGVGAAKADFWRYCILYKHGGIYLDIDSQIVKPLSDLIEDTDQCIITRESNPGIFNNWILIFAPNHPILWKCIQNCVYNIQHKTSQDICRLTGPIGPFTDAINATMQRFMPSEKHGINLYFETDEYLNKMLNDPSLEIRCRFFGVDANSFAVWKHRACQELYDGHIYWRDDPEAVIRSADVPNSVSSVFASTMEEA
jgi:inositol phosphorylceramide mannosyltransferase catalytic subunit